MNKNAYIIATSIESTYIKNIYLNSTYIITT